MRYDQIPNLADKMKEYLISTRRTLHRHPETSGNEEWTSIFLQNEIKDLGLPIEMVSKTGFIATLDTGRPGPHIVLRFRKFLDARMYVDMMRTWLCCWHL